MQRHDHSSQPSVAIGERMDGLELCMENGALNEPILGLSMGVAFPCGHQFAHPELAKVPDLDLAAGAGEPRVQLEDLFDRFPARALYAPARAGGIS